MPKRFCPVTAIPHGAPTAVPGAGDVQEQGAAGRARAVAEAGQRRGGDEVQGVAGDEGEGGPDGVVGVLCELRKALQFDSMPDETAYGTGTEKVRGTSGTR